MAPGRELNLKVNLSYGEEFIQDEDAQAKILMFNFWGIIMPIICFIGLIGNVLTIIVLFRKEMRSPTVYFLQTLVITDTGILVGATLGLSVISITQLNPSMWYFTDVIYPRIFMPVNYVVMSLQFVNVWTTVAVSLERYIAICHPFSHFKICKRRNALIIIFSVTVISLLYNVPRCFETTFQSCGENCATVVTTDFGNRNSYRNVYLSYVYTAVIYILPLILLVVLNTLLVRELMRMRQRRVPTSNQENTEINLSVVLVLIVVIFILCQTPGLVAQFHFFEALVLLKWLCVSNTLFVLNSSVNFLVYAAVGKKFRNTLFAICKGVLKHRKSARERSCSIKSYRYSQSGINTELITMSSSELPDTDNSDETCTLKGRGT